MTPAAAVAALQFAWPELRPPGHCWSTGWLQLVMFAETAAAVAVPESAVSAVAAAVGAFAAAEAVAVGEVKLAMLAEEQTSGI